MKLKMCRICLVEDVTMFPITKTPLQEIYEKLTAMKLETNTCRPIQVCYMCYARLWKCYHLRHSCLRSEEMFKQMIINDNQRKLSKPKAVLKTNILTITPVNQINIYTCTMSHERDEAVSGIKEQTKTEATLSEEIAIKMEGGDTSDAEEDALSEIPDTYVKIEIDGCQDNFTGDDSAPAKKLPTTFSLEHRSSKLKKLASAETENKEELLTRKSHKTNKVIITGTVISEDKILDKLENTTKLQEKSVTITIKQPTVCSDANIKPIRQDFSKTTYLEHVPIPTAKGYKCDICNKQFNGKGDLDKHYITHTSERPRKCNINSKQFSQKGNLVTHLHTHTGETPYKCNVCNKQFNEKTKLLRHLRTHTGERRYKCDVCDKNFSHSSHLVRHLRTHSGEKPFKCDVCNKQFNQNADLVRHLRTHTGERPYKCDVCDKNFSHNSHLVRHLRTHTGERPYKCDICNKQFNQNADLVRHLRTHTGERPYKCNVCDKQFSLNCNLVTHLRTHTGERLYKCDVCNK